MMQLAILREHTKRSLAHFLASKKFHFSLGEIQTQLHTFLKDIRAHLKVAQKQPVFGVSGCTTGIEEPGGVGTGKSWYAIEQARRLAENAGGDSGRDVLMVAYNLALCELLRNSAGKLGLQRGSITVHSSESIAASILEASTIPHEVPAVREVVERYLNETLPLLAIEALTTEPAKIGHLLGKFDALVVDEAQGHDTSLPGDSSQPDHAGWWSIYFALLSQGWQSPMAIFGDAAQRPPFRAPDRFALNTVRQRLDQHAHLRLNCALR
jgi:hypothetical protein